MRVPGAQRFPADRLEPYDELRVIVERIDADHGADAKLRMADAQAWTEGETGRLIFILVGIRRLGFFDTSAAAVRIGPKIVVGKVPLIRRRK